jgi:hypothetical protein
MKKSKLNGMTLQDISSLRLINQQIAGSKFTTAKDVVDWMGAMQAQDYSMAKWAVGLRVPGSTEKTIESAIDNGEIIRTHVLRPTWHFVSPDDIYWMLSLTAPQIRSAMRSRDKQLELDRVVYSKSNSILEKALAGGNHLTREEIAIKFNASGINTSENRLSHILMQAELEQIICSGKSKNNKITYALLAESVPHKNILNRDESLSKLANTYFSSHGPATLKDFAWWSGLSVSDSRKALEMVKSNFVSEIIGEEIYWFTNSSPVSPTDKNAIFMLPAFDEFIISYKDRTAALIFENHRTAVSNNGIFRPVIVQSGMVTGIWKRTSINKRIILETNFFQTPPSQSREMIADAFSPFISFIGKEVEIR